MTTPKRSGEGQLDSPAKKARMEPKGVRFYERRGGSAQSGNSNLPPTIEVDKFAQARVFEINALQQAMRAAKEAGVQRAFQTLPRALRRRAASHNIRRLPMRLRAKAKSETPKDAAKPKKVTRSMLGRKSKRIGPNAERFAKRQRTKLWLETHVWHAKRMHMIDLWGHRLADRPTAKAFRASYRASVHGALVHDASYFQYIEVTGPEEEVKALLAKVADETLPSPGGKRFISGQRECQTTLIDPTTSLPLGPAAVIWDTPAPAPAPAPAHPSQPSTSALPARKALLRLHPALCAQAWTALQEAKAVLWPLGNLTCMPRRMEKELVTFEVTGKRATEVVKSVLRPVKGTEKETKEGWRLMSGERGPGGVPRGMVVGVEVYDPRLAFPPKLGISAPPLTSDSLLVPSATLASVPRFWSPTLRNPLGRPRFTKHQLDARRTQLLVPGTPLTPLAQDDRIPVLLSQRTLASPQAPDQALHGWTITLPAGWGQAFFASLVYASPRVAGQVARRQQAFEAGVAGYPQDAVGTKGFDEYEIRREVEERGFWERRPPAKRPNYAKLGGGLDEVWSVGRGMRAVVERWSGGELADGEGVWIVPGKRAGEMEARVRAGEKVRVVQEVVVGEKWRGGLVQIRVDMVGRGRIEDLGVLYWLEDEERAEVAAALEPGKVKVARAKGELAPDELTLQPSKASIVGRVTSGGFSLALGRASAIAVVNLEGWLRIVKRDADSVKSGVKVAAGLALARNRDGEVFRAATLTRLD